MTGSFNLQVVHPTHAFLSLLMNDLYFLVDTICADSILNLQVPFISQKLLSNRASPSFSTIDVFGPIRRSFQEMKGRTSSTGSFSIHTSSI